MSEQNIFSIRLKELRSSLNMTQVQFANHVGTNQVTLSAYETGSTNPSLEIVKEIATKCNVSIDWLCGLSNNKTFSNKCETYYDVLNTLVKLCSTKYTDSRKDLMTISFKEEPLTSNMYISFNTPSDHILVSFFNNWLKMHSLLEENVINQEIYNQWLEGQLSEHKDHKIDGVPF